MSGGRREKRPRGHPGDLPGAVPQSWSSMGMKRADSMACCLPPLRPLPMGKRNDFVPKKCRLRKKQTGKEE